MSSRTPTLTKTTSASTEYVYNSLEADEIRLLELQAGDEDAELHGVLHVFRLPVEDEPLDYEVLLTRDIGVDTPNAPPYDALSYCWGAARKGQHRMKILQDGKLRNVYLKPNLMDALKRLRQEIPQDGTKMLWADSICINQDNYHEKNAQIRKMANIYNRAENVVVWLGSEDKNSGRAIKFMERLLNLEDFDLISKETGSENDWAALHHLMQRPWFSRRWVVQEVSLARNATLFCGNESVSWQDFSAAVALFVARYRDLRQLFQRSAEFHNHPNYLGEVEALGAKSLVDITTNLFRKSDEGAVLERLLSLEAIITTLTPFEASTPHDTIYSVLWLAHDAEPDSKERYAMAQSQLVRTPLGSPDISHAPSPDGSEGSQSAQNGFDRSPQPMSPVDDSGYFSQMSQRQPDFLTQADASQRQAAENHAFLKPPLRLKRTSTRSAADHSLSAVESQFKAKPHSIIVDYNTEVYEVFSQFLDFAMSRSRSLDIICHPWAPEPPQGEAELPSWIPLLSSAPFDKKPGRSSYGRVRADSLVGTPGVQRNYNASGKTKIYPSTDFIQDRSLTVTGFVLDAINTRNSVAVEGIIPSGWVELAGWAGSPDPVPDRFWRTLVADRGPGGHKYPPAYFALACKWVLEQRPRRGNINTNEILMFGQCPSIATEFLHRVQSVVWDRMLILTEGRKRSKQLLALVPKEAEPGDIICILYGCSVPVVLRRWKKRKANNESAPRRRNTKRTTGGQASVGAQPPTPGSTNPSISFSRASSTSRQSDAGLTDVDTPLTGLTAPSEPVSTAFASTGVRNKLTADIQEPYGTGGALSTPSDSQHRYTFIGECYVHGMMAGEGFKHSKDHGNPLRAFHLI